MKQFEKHRIVFWYDIKEELREEYEDLGLGGIEKVEIKNNQFGLKYRMLRQEPDQRFLLYHEGPPPDNIDNWLLDVELAHGQFKADQVSLWLTEIGLEPNHWNLANEHKEFFRAKSRREELSKLTEGSLYNKELKMKMLAVCTGLSSDVRFDGIIENLLNEEARGNDERIRLIDRSNLLDFLWLELENRYSYRSEQPGIRDFALKLFQTGYSLALGEEAPLPASAAALMNRWKDSLQHKDAFETLSEEYADLLNIKKDLEERSAQELAGVDIYRLVDQKILSDLARQVVEKTITAAECEKLVWERRGTHWFSEFMHIYEAIRFGAKFLDLLAKAELAVKTLGDGFTKYVSTWYQLDFCYRKCVYHAQASHQVSLLEKLLDEVQRHYSNTYLLTINDRWQEIVDKHKVWEIPGEHQQKGFFKEYVERKFLRDQKKVVVIISDAMRYEIAAEFFDVIRAEDRYDAELEAMVGILPSATAFGMAALLPHDELSITEKGEVLADGKSTQGTQNRSENLSSRVPDGAIALQAADFMKMNKDDSRLLFRDHQLIYIYHNQIDAIGDDRSTEDQAFKAAEDTISDLVDLVKKMTSANATNLLVTADHGFIYQNEVLEESDFVHLEELEGDIHKQTRRWMLGSGGEISERLKHYQPEDLGYQGEADIYLAKSINRLRLKGVGSKYVHGGASLQEITIPVLWINKKRESDVELVEVDILRGSTQIISTGQISVSFYQEEATTAKCQPRILRAGIYAVDDTLISDRHQLKFDLSTEDKREREVKQTFVLSHTAEEYNQQEVFLKLEERIPGSDIYRKYKTMRYQLQRSFTSDFDF